MQVLPAPRTGVTGLTFSPDGDMLAGVSDRAVLCWTRSRGWEQTGLRHQGDITGVAFHPNGRTLAYSAQLRSRRATSAIEAFTGVRLYPLGATPEFKPELLLLAPAGERAPIPEPIINGVEFSADGRTLFACVLVRPLFRSARAVVRQWNFSTTGPAWQRVTESTVAQTETTNGTAVLGGSALVLVGTWGVRVCPLTGLTGEVLVRDVSRCRAVAVAPGHELVAAVAEQHVWVWHLRDAGRAGQVPVPSGSATAAAFAPSAETLATGHADGTVSLWNPFAGERKAVFDFGVGAVQSLVYAPDGLTLAVGGRKGLVVFDVD